MNDAVIETVGLKKTYGSKTAVADLTLGWDGARSSAS